MRRSRTATRILADATRFGRDLPKADLVVAAYALAEIARGRCRRASSRRCGKRAAGVLVLVEPGTPAGFARIRDGARGAHRRRRADRRALPACARLSDRRAGLVPFRRAAGALARSQAGEIRRRAVRGREIFLRRRRRGRRSRSRRTTARVLAPPRSSKAEITAEALHRRTGPSPSASCRGATATAYAAPPPGLVGRCDRRRRSVGQPRLRSSSGCQSIGRGSGSGAGAAGNSPAVPRPARCRDRRSAPRPPR